MIAVSVPGHSRFGIGALDVRGAGGGYKLILNVVMGPCHTAVFAHHLVVSGVVGVQRTVQSPLTMTFIAPRR